MENSITEEIGRNSDYKKEEEHMNKEVHESCNFPEAIHIVRPL
jgi:hypothetical protein